MKRVEFQLRNFRIISMSRKKSMTRYQSENARSNSLQPRSIFISSKFAKIIPKLRETRLSPQARQEMDNHKKSLFEERIHD